MSVTGLTERCGEPGLLGGCGGSTPIWVSLSGRLIALQLALFSYLSLTLCRVTSEARKPILRRS